MRSDAAGNVQRTAEGVDTKAPGIVLGILGFAVFTAVGARLSVPLPGTPVPMTLQPVAVLLAGVVLGSRAGAASQIAYLAAGFVGLPVFAAGGGAAYLLGPTGGYLLAFPVAAAVAGIGARDRGSWLREALWLAAALGVIHAGGLSWLALLGGGSLVASTGVSPFILGDALKVVLVLAISRYGWGALRRADQA